VLGQVIAWSGDASPEKQTRRLTVNMGLGVRTHENSTLVLIDCQREMLETFRSETSAELAREHA
jgi:hypothetical protein